MLIVSIILVAVGVCFLLFSLKPAATICMKDKHLGWKLIFLLIIFFIIGYCVFTVHLFAITNSSFVENTLSVILFAGSIFVLMVINFSVKSISNIQSIADIERYNSLHDSLTGIPNRKHFLNTIGEQLKLNKPFSVLVLDINSFKKTNEMIGHYCADYLLVKFVTAVKQKLPEDSFFARIGADEFALISEAVAPLEIEELNWKLHLPLAKPFNINGNLLKVSISVGASISTQNRDNPISLFQQAHIAMNVAKKKQIEFMLYDLSLDSDDKQRLEISNKLHSALDESEFDVFYQPLINRNGKANNKNIYHFEALIRWPQTDGSFIPPDKFIPIAEHNGLIQKITEYVLDKVGKHFHEFQQAGIEACIHINVSARDLQDNNFPRQLDNLIKEQKILAQQIVLEVTETAILVDIMAAKEMLLRLTKKGFLISLDDFGTGFSSLSLLLELPINQIKVDRSFVNAMVEGNTNHSIVRSVISLAHDLKCTVVAEGVETKALTEQLIKLKCDYLQGYYYSKPVSIASIIDFCRKSR